MVTLLKILLAATILFASVFILDTTGVFTYLFMASEDTIADMMEEEHPDANIDIDLQENCTICDESGCRTYPGPCWEITVIEEEESGLVVTDMILDAAGSVIEEQSRPCVEWWCDAESCSYTRTETIDDVVNEFTNSDCPDGMICEQEHEKCRPCNTGSECIFRIIKFGEDSVFSSFEVHGTGEKAEINDLDLVCRISSRGAVIHEQPLTMEECGNLMYEHTACTDGACDYAPAFTLLPP